MPDQHQLRACGRISPFTLSEMWDALLNDRLVWGPQPNGGSPRVGPADLLAGDFLDLLSIEERKEADELAEKILQSMAGS